MEEKNNEIKNRIVETYAEDMAEVIGNDKEAGLNLEEKVATIKKSALTGS